jgi:hypothetical protein
MATLARQLRWPLLVGSIVALLGTTAPEVQGQKPSEYQVKAAYLYGFGRFVDWPATAAPAETFVVCVLGRDPFGHWLDEVAAGAVINDKPVSVHRISLVQESGSCRTLFVSAAEADRLAEILDALAHRPVLTVGDAPQFAQRGGMIGFSLEGNRVRFTVNLGATHNAGLELNSELLRVAALILRSRPPGA